VVDTGGMLPDEKELIPAEIFRQAQVALDQADAVILVIDGRSELAAPDIDLARMLLRSGRKLFLAVNKMDSPKLDAAAENFRQLGIRELYPISAEHGAGVAELLDAVLEALPEKKRITEETEVTEEASDAETGAAAAGARVERETRIAIIGRPNVGKSTLLNQLTQSSRAI